MRNGKPTIASTKDYVILRWERKGEVPTFDIENENLRYCTLGNTHHGLQCNYEGDTIRYEAIKNLCVQVVDLIKQIDDLNSTPYE